MMAIIYGQDEREMWLEMVKRMYVVMATRSDSIAASIVYADHFVAAMRKQQEQDGGK